MRKVCFLAAVFALLSLSVFAHDLFLKLDSYFVAVNEKVSIKVLNGSFQTSEGAVTYSRLRDLSLVNPSGTRVALKDTDMTKDEKTAYLNLQPSEAGTYVVGLSTRTRNIDLKAKEFNEYLVEDGIPDTLAERKRKKQMEKDARERYSKHVKTIFQVGAGRTENYKIALGYPVEIIPQKNPYNLKAGDTFEFLCLKNGKPLKNQYVMSGYETNGQMIGGENARTDKKGIARFRLGAAGKWYVRFIQMSPLKEPPMDYESNWATLTFEIK